MSTLTKNGFIKPELSDTADITAYNENWELVDEALSYLYMLSHPLSAFSDDGIHYWATLTDKTMPTDGLEVIIIPQMTNTSANPTLAVDFINDKPIRLSLSTNTSATIPVPVGFLVEGHPIKLRYDENRDIWRIVDKQKTSASDLYGSVPIANGGHGGTTAEEAIRNLGALPAVLVEGEHYDTELPEPGNKGRLFVKIIT